MLGGLGTGGIVVGPTAHGTRAYDDVALAVVGRAASAPSDAAAAHIAGGEGVAAFGGGHGAVAVWGQAWDDGSDGVAVVHPPHYLP